MDKMVIYGHQPISDKYAQIPEKSYENVVQQSQPMPNFAPNERSDFNSVNCSELTKVTNCLKFSTIATFELPKAVPIIHLIDSRLINDNGKLQLQEDSPACTRFRKIQTGHSLLRTGGRTCTPLWILNGRSLSRRRVRSLGSGYSSRT